MSRPSLWLTIAAASVLTPLLAERPAHAETTASQRAAAEALFQQAAQLMDEKRYPEACDKFSGSQELDPALGTMLYLADCYEHAGRTASAWALFREASDTAQRAGQADRQRIALERANSLEQRLSKLELRVSKEREVPNLELLVNGAVVSRASWNTPLPVDPGPTRIEGRAPGKKPWTSAVTIQEGPASQSVELAKLADAPRQAKTRDRSETPGSNGSAQRTVGYVMTAAGVVALAAGGFFGYRAYALNKKSMGECRADEPNACTSGGVALREDAKTAGALSTITTMGGGLLVASGITLIVTAPTGVVGHDETRTAHNFSPSFGFSMRGAW